MIRSSDHYQRCGTQAIDDEVNHPWPKVNYHAIMMMRVMIENEGRSLEDALRQYKSIFAWFLPASLIEETERTMRSKYPNPEGSCHATRVTTATPAHI